MKLQLLSVGRLSAPFLREGVDEYAGRIARYLPFSCAELREEKGGGRKVDPRFIREREGEQILARVPQGAFAVVLDEQGRAHSSQQLAGLIEEHMVAGTPEVVWIIGGPYGLSAPVKRRADLLLSLSAMTFTHQMARLFLLEQIYRALTIIRNEPYHNR